MPSGRLTRARAIPLLKATLQAGGKAADQTHSRKELKIVAASITKKVMTPKRIGDIRLFPFLSLLLLLLVMSNRNCLFNGLAKAICPRFVAFI
jgi:hypothetical protein